MRLIGLGAAIGGAVGWILAEDHPHAIFSPVFEMLAGIGLGALVGLLIDRYARRRPKTSTD